jgi:hypothetical protein
MRDKIIIPNTVNKFIEIIGEFKGLGMKVTNKFIFTKKLRVNLTGGLDATIQIRVSVFPFDILKCENECIKTITFPVVSCGCGSSCLILRKVQGFKM